MVSLSIHNIVRVKVTAPWVHRDEETGAAQFTSARILVEYMDYAGKVREQEVVLFAKGDAEGVLTLQQEPVEEVAA